MRPLNGPLSACHLSPTLVRVTSVFACLCYLAVVTHVPTLALAYLGPLRAAQPPSPATHTCACITEVHCVTECCCGPKEPSVPDDLESSRREILKAAFCGETSTTDGMTGQVLAAQDIPPSRLTAHPSLIPSGVVPWEAAPSPVVFGSQPDKIPIHFFS